MPSIKRVEEEVIGEPYRDYFAATVVEKISSAGIDTEIFKIEIEGTGVLDLALAPASRKLKAGDIVYTQLVHARSAGTEDMQTHFVREHRVAEIVRESNGGVCTVQFEDDGEQEEMLVKRDYVGDINTIVVVRTFLPDGKPQWIAVPNTK